VPSFATRAFLIGFTVLFLFVTPCFAHPHANDNLKSFDLVWKTVNAIYFAPTFGGIDWNPMRGRYRPQIASSRGIEEFKRITNPMLFELGSSHLFTADALRRTHCRRPRHVARSCNRARS